MSEERDLGAVSGHGVVLTGNALVPLGIVVSIILSAVGAAWYISGELHMIQNEIMAIRIEQREIKNSLRNARASIFSPIDARIWAGQFATMNPTLKVPEPIHYPLPGETSPENP